MPPVRFYIWPRYAIEFNGKRIVLPPKPGAALARLFSARGHYVSLENMIEAVYFDDPDGGPLTADSCIAVLICRIRKLLAKMDMRVVGGRWAGGYRMIFGDEPLGIDYAEPLNGHHGPHRYDSKPDCCAYDLQSLRTGTTVATVFRYTMDGCQRKAPKATAS